MLGDVQVGHNGSRGGDGQRHILYAKTLQGVGVKLLYELLISCVIDKCPAIHGGDKGLVGKALAKTIFEPPLQQDLLGREVGQQQVYEVERALRHAEGAGGDVQECRARQVFLEIEGAQPVVFGGVEQRFVVVHAGGHQLGDAALDQFFGEFGVFQLVADGHFVAGSDHFWQINVYGVVRNPREIRVIAGTGGLAGQYEPQHLAHHDGVVCKGLVEVAHAVE